MINLGLIGYPLQGSYSPKIHKAALEFCNLRGNYSLFPVLPNDLQRLKSLLNRVRSSEIAGLNVTIPYKQSVLPLLDELTMAAQAIGAVNTISMQNGKLTGDNTDAPGFLADIQKFITKETWEREENYNALVLGGGGSARAITYALVNDGWKVTLATRRPENAQAIITQFSNRNSLISNIEYHANAFRPLISSIHLIINATPVGMSPNIENSPWPTNLSYPQGAAFYDLVYNPRDTKFVLGARAAGLRAITGLGMLIEQAALSFERWTGRVAPRKEMLCAVTENLANRTDYPHREIGN